MCKLEEILRALATRRRRRLLSCLRSHQSVHLADLAEIIAERERGERVTDIAAEEIQALYMTLYHDHVPVLEEAGLVRYDQEADVVVWGDHAMSRIDRARRTVQALLEE